MKKAIVFLTAILTVCLGFFCLSACVDKGSLTVKFDTITLALNGAIYIGDYVDYNGRNKLAYAVENTDVLSLEKDKVTGIKEGTGYLVVTAGENGVRIRVDVVDRSRIKLVASDVVTVYDGTLKNIQYLGTLPEGGTVQYLHNGVPFAGIDIPGTYEIEIEAKLPEGYTAEYSKKTAILTIERAVFPLGNLSFRSQTVEYDGQEKVLTLTGDIPEGLTVTYETNAGTNAGMYGAKAFFAVNETYYKPVQPMTAQLTILKKSFAVPELENFADKKFVYDGEKHLLTAGTMPVGLAVDYSVWDASENGYVSIADFEDKNHRAFINAGEYRLRARFTVDKQLLPNYNTIKERTASVTIQKAKLTNNLVWKTKGDGLPRDFVYSGTGVTVGTGDEFDVGLTGEFPHGPNDEFAENITVRYLKRNTNGSITEIRNDDFINAGSYTLIARFSVPDDALVNYESIPDSSYGFAIVKKDYEWQPIFEATSTEGLDFNATRTFDEKHHYFAVHFVDDEAESNFLRDAELHYYVSKNNGEFQLNIDGRAGIFGAGNYVVEARLKFRTGVGFEHLKNYNLIPMMQLKISISKLTVFAPDVKFEDAEFSYSGETFSIFATGMPEGVRAEYKNNTMTDAGSASAQALFYYKDFSNDDNYIIRKEEGGDKLVGMTAKITVNKAVITGKDVDFTQFSTEGGKYVPGKKLADYPIRNAGNAVIWKDPDEKPTVDRYLYQAIYNKDKKNYEDYSFNITLIVEPIVLDGRQLAVNDQFVPYTGKTVSPAFTYDAKPTAYFNLTFECETDGKNLGEHALKNIVLKLKDEINYQLMDAPLILSLTVYIYNNSLFEYSGLQLSKYKGMESEVVVPVGTKSIANQAFKDCFTVRSLIFPDTVESFAARSVTGKIELTHISLPFTGKKRTDTTRYVGMIFGGTDNSSLPPTLRSVTVTGETTIPSYAFRNAKNLDSVVYTQNVTEVGDGAFYGCVSLLAADFGKAEVLGEGIFQFCFNLNALTVPFVGKTSTEPNRMSYLVGNNTGENEYKNYKLKTLQLTEATTLADRTFADFVSLESIVFPHVRNYGKESFSGSTASFVLHDGILTLTERMYFGYKGSISVPSSVTRIEKDAFRGGKGGGKVVLPEGLTFIGVDAFYGVSAEISLSPGSMTKLEERAFAGYMGRGITIPSNITELGNQAFYGSALNGAVIPNTVTVLGESIFEGCTNLKTAEINTAYVGKSMFKGCSTLTTVSFGGKLQAIEESAFENCSRLDRVALPSDVTTVAKYAFRGCSAMTMMTFASVRPPEVANFALPNKIVSVYVPEQSLTQYKKAFASFTNLNIYPSASAL